jgi:hypothetical protein
MTPDKPTNPERQASALKDWLEAPAGSPPPSDLDGEVVQALYALRPELAPAPRVTADDILASVTRGPLARGDAPAGDRSEGGGAEIVPFPAARAPARSAESDPAAVRRPRWSRRIGGLGIALAAAATLLVVALPLTRPSPDAAPAPTTSAPAAQPVAQSPAAAAAPAEPELAPARQAPPAAADVPQIATRPAASPPPVAQTAPPALEMRDGAVYREPSVIPEALEQRMSAAAGEAAPELDQVAAAPAEAQLSSEDAPADKLSDKRARAESKVADGDGWRKGVDKQQLAKIDAALTQAASLRASGDYQGAGDALAAVVQPPARAGQYVARLAASDYLAAGQLGAAESVARRGLALGSAKSAERDALLVALGDALQASGDQAGAAAAYDQAN